MNSVITSLGGTVSASMSGSGIYINIVNALNADNTIPAYNSSLNPNYNVVIYSGFWSGVAYGPYTNNNTQLTNYYNAGIGIVLSYQSSNTLSLPTALKISSVVNNTTTMNIVNYNISNPNNNALSYGCSSTIINGNFSYGKNFTSLNNSISIPDTNGINVVNYLDTTGKGRRVDINSYFDQVMVNNNTTMIRLVLQSCLWAGKKINMTSSLTITPTTLNLSNPILQKLQVYNNPSTDYDIVNKSYLTSFTSKYSKILTTTDYYVYVDLNKPHQFSLSYTTGGTNNAGGNYHAILYTFPLIDNSHLPYKIITGTSGITQYYQSNNGTVVFYNLIKLNLIAGLLYLCPNTDGTPAYPTNIQLYEL